MNTTNRAYQRAFLLSLTALMAFLPGCGNTAYKVAITPHEDQQRIDITVNGDLFTSYVYHDSISTLKKPVLFPIMSAQGHFVTRGFPLKPRAGERADHPHHAGLWFTYGDVNGLDFWGFSDATPQQNWHRMGTIKHRGLKSVKNNEMTVAMDWVKPDGSVLLKEETRFIFHAGPNMRAVDRITTLTALEDADFNDTKEGMTGLRVNRALEHPTDRPITLTDAQGEVETVPVLDNTGVTGEYLSSEGITGIDVWGTRARWMALRGVIEGEDLAVVIFDHPENPGYPTYWHARGYGLFTANPFGHKDFTNDQHYFNFKLLKGESTTFVHRYLFQSGPTTAEQFEALYQQFVNETP